MANSLLTTKLTIKDKEYLVQTSWLESEKMIITSLFAGGKFVSKQVPEYSNELSADQRSDLLKQVHQRQCQETASLLQLSVRPDGRQNQAEIHFLLGEAFYHRRLLEEAEAELKESLDSIPENPQAIELLGRVCLTRGDFAQAAEHFQRGVDLYPHYADFCLLYSLALAALERYSPAIDQIERAIQINPYYAQAHFELGMVLIQNMLRRKEYELTLGLPEKAIQSFNQAAQLNPAFLSPVFTLGLDLLRQGNYSQAYQHLSACTAIRKDRSPNYLHEYYLKFLSSNGSLDEKSLSQQIKSLQQLVDKNPAYADLHFQLGTVYMLLCRYITEKAVSQYKKALQFNPNYKKAEKNMKLCENDIKGMDLLLRAMI